MGLSPFPPSSSFQPYATSTSSTMTRSPTRLTTSTAWNGDLEPLRPEDSISCVGEEGFKSRRRDSPLFDSRYSRNRVRTQPPPPVRVVETYTKPSSSKRPSLPRSKPKTTTTTTHTIQYREPPAAAAYYGDNGFKSTLPLRPPHSRKHNATKHPMIAVEREPSYASCSTKTSSRPPPPRSNDRFYDYRRVKPVDSRGRTSLDTGHRGLYAAPRAYSQDRGSGGGVYGALRSLTGSSRDRGSSSGSKSGVYNALRSLTGFSKERGSASSTGYERSSGRDDLRYVSRKPSHTRSSSYVEGRRAEGYRRTGDHRGYEYFRR